MRTIVPIVEGPGDVAAIPEMIRRVLNEILDVWDIQVVQGMKLGRGGIVDPSSLRRHLRLASITPGCRLILVFADRDDSDCVPLAQHIRNCATNEGLGDRVEALVINREYETWLLAGIESLRGKRGILDEATVPETLQIIRDPKARLTQSMLGSRAYSETADQAALTCLVDLEQVSTRCACFSKLIDKLKRHTERTECLTTGRRISRS